MNIRKTALTVAVLAAAVQSLPVMAYPTATEVGDTYLSAYTLSGFNLSFDPDIEDSTIIPHTSVVAHNDATTDVDWFRFSVLAGSSIHLDIDTDNWGGLFDTTMALWDPSGNVIGQSDDWGYDPGSTSAGYYYYNSQIYAGAPITGTYYVSVSNYANFADGSSAFCCYDDDGGYATSGGYDLHVSVSDPIDPIPEPGSLALLTLGLGLIGFRSAKTRAIGCDRA